MTALTDLLAQIDVHQLIRYHDKEAAFRTNNGQHLRALRHSETAEILRALIEKEGE